ncbi:MAG: glycogen/starch synthase [Patescibacteria group bacterium]
MNKPLTILMATAEIAPYARTGGLADVCNALPKALVHLGQKVIVVMPYYGFIRNQNLKIEEIGEDNITINKNNYHIKYRRTFFTPEIPIYFIYNWQLFNRSRLYNYADDNLRFLFFDLAVLKMIEKFKLKIDVIHCQDWHAGLIPNYLAKKFRAEIGYSKIATLFTIHNLPFQFQQNWWTIPKKLVDDGHHLPPVKKEGEIKNINFTKRALLNADIINTVSERYAKEIMTPEFGQGLHRILRARKKDVFGIINGIDYNVYNPLFDPYIRHKYDWNSLDKKKKNKLLLQKEMKLKVDPDIPLIGLVHRLTEQKGFDLILRLMDFLLKMDIQFIVVGSGQKEYINSFRKLNRKFPRKIAISSPFTDKMAARVYAGSDMFLMPSRYEPCGISQMISLRYGSIPIVHETGGLSDTITDFDPRKERGNGFVFSRFIKEDFLAAIIRALVNYKYRKTWEHLTWQAMRLSYSWEIPAKKYLALYYLAIKKLREKKTS